MKYSMWLSVYQWQWRVEHRAKSFLGAFVNVLMLVFRSGRETARDEATEEQCGQNYLGHAALWGTMLCW